MLNPGMFLALCCSLMHNISKLSAPLIFHGPLVYSATELDTIISWAIMYSNCNTFFCMSRASLSGFSNTTLARYAFPRRFSLWGSSFALKVEQWVLHGPNPLGFNTRWALHGWTSSYSSSFARGCCTVTVWANQCQTHVGLPYPHYMDGISIILWV